VSLQFRVFTAESSRCAKCGGVHRSPITAAVSHVVKTLIAAPPDLAPAIRRSRDGTDKQPLAAALSAGRSSIAAASPMPRSAAAPPAPDLKAALKKEKR